MLVPALVTDGFVMAPPTPIRSWILITKVRIALGCPSFSGYISWSLSLEWPHFSFRTGDFCLKYMHIYISISQYIWFPLKLSQVFTFMIYNDDCENNKSGRQAELSKKSARGKVEMSLLQADNSWWHLSIVTCHLTVSSTGPLLSFPTSLWAQLYTFACMALNNTGSHIQWSHNNWVGYWRNLRFSKAVCKKWGQLYPL